MSSKDNEITCKHCFMWGFLVCRCHKGEHLIKVATASPDFAVASQEQWQLFVPKKTDA